jgi:hypothetical protein
METNIKVNADLNRAIDQLAEKLGIAAEEIIPHYTKILFAGGVARFTAGFLLATLPYLLFLFYPEVWEANEIFIGVRLAFCIIMTICGVTQMANWFENIIAPQGEAISQLINELRN